MSRQGRLQEEEHGSREFLLTGEETDGRLLEMRVTYEPGSPFPPPHFHPDQAETFHVESGELVVRLDGRDSRMEEGDTLVVPPGSVHQMRNASGTKTTVNWRVEPALRTAEFFVTANAIRTHGILEQALLAAEYRDEFRLAGSLLPRMAVPVVAAIARVAGRSLPTPKRIWPA